MAEQTPPFTERDVVLLRAALRYWQDEMAPHDSDMMAAYFETDKRDALPGPHECIGLLERLEKCSIRYAVCDADNGTIVENCLYQTLVDAEAGSADNLRVATVLLSKSFM